VLLLNQPLVAQGGVHANARLTDAIDDHLEACPGRDRLSGCDDQLGLTSLDALLGRVVAGRRAHAGGTAAVLEMLLLRSKSRLNSLRHCVDFCINSTCVPGRNLLVTAS